MFSVGFEMEIIKRWGRWASATSHQYLWRGEYIMSNISRGMLNSTKDTMSNKPPFYSQCRAGGKRGKPASGERGRLVSISIAMSKGLRHYCLEGMNDEGWAPMKSVLQLYELLELSANVDDVFKIVSGGGGNNKKRFELSGDRRLIRCAQGHSVGSGVRPNCLPVTTSVEYLVHGTTFEAAAVIAESGLSRRNRLHIHFYECGRKGYILGNMHVRWGSEVAIAISALHCADGGIVFHRAANNVIVSEGIDGVIGAQYFCFIHKLHRGPMKRSVIWERRGWVGRPMDTTQDDYPTTMSVRNPDSEMEDDQTMYTAQSGGKMHTPQSMPTDDQYPKTPRLRDIAGLNPFSPDSDSELTGVSMIQEEIPPSSCASRLTGMNDVKEDVSISSFDNGRLADDEITSPPPSRAAKMEVKTKQEESEPIFATFKVRNRISPTVLRIFRQSSQ